MNTEAVLGEHKAVRVRFAPSPTGLLHIGGARTALFNYLFAKKHNGTFILRIDDTDKERSLIENEEEIIHSLNWLGLTWDEGAASSNTPHGSYHQAKRLQRHLEFAAILQKSSAAYTDSEGCVRLRYPDQDIVVKDIICGDCRFSPNSLGPDPVILRSDGTPTYHLASVADDIDFEITHIIRGQDHLTNTAKHIVLFEAAGAKIPEFAHLPLILGEDGSKLSKRNSTGYTTVKEFREKGFLPSALLNFLNLLGWSHPESKDIFDLTEAANNFTLERVNITGAKFELSKLDWFNGQYLRALSEEDLANITLPWTGEFRTQVESKGLNFWTKAVTALKTDIARLNDVEKVASLLLSEHVEPNQESIDFIENEISGPVYKEVRSSLLTILNEHYPEEGESTFSQPQVKAILKLVKNASKAQAKLVFQSARIILTGALRGAELDVLLPHVDRTLIISRVSNSRE